MLVLPHLGIGLRVVEVRVRVENMQHPRNGAVVNNLVDLVAVELVGVVVFHDGVDVGERLH